MTRPLPRDWDARLREWCDAAVRQRPDGSRSELVAIVAELAYRSGRDDVERP